MPARGKGARGDRTREQRFSIRPFANLAAAFRAVPPSESLPRAPQFRSEFASNAESDAELFSKAMADVVPLPDQDRARVEMAGPACPPRPLTDEDAEALAELSELANGGGSFDVTLTDEHVEGICSGLDLRLLQRLRRGEFACQGHLDLHGCTWEQAKLRVDAFLTQALRDGKRCVLIVHGRGRNSKDQVPVLKSRLTTYLSRSRWSRALLAFCSARPVDGGPGATYVLLRRRRGGRGQWRVAAGTHW